MIKSLLCAVWLPLLICFVGCGGSGHEPAPIVVNGTAINIATFRQAFGSAKPEVVKTADKVLLSISYGDCPSALKDLAALAGESALTASQKEAVKKLNQEVSLALGRDGQKAP